MTANVVDAGSEDNEPKATAQPLASSESASTTADESKSTSESQEEQLRAYSKEIYDFTLGLLNEVKADEASRKGFTFAGKVGSHYLKRTVSDDVVARKADGTDGE